MIGHVVNCATSSEIWNTLEQLFGTASRARQIHLMNQLQSTKKESLAIDEYLLKMKNLTDGLRAAGNPISDEQLIFYVLTGLGTETNLALPLPMVVEIQTTLQDVEEDPMVVDQLMVVAEVIRMAINPSVNFVVELVTRFRGVTEGSISYNGADENDTTSGPNQPQALVASTGYITDEAWYLDSGASYHFTQDNNNLHQQSS
uniref:Polyprotein n=1 Tax=Cannabis sativa TaxID=3483 RepID=A0A803PHP6_CANSA